MVFQYFDLKFGIQAILDISIKIKLVILFLKFCVWVEIPDVAEDVNEICITAICHLQDGR